MFLEWVIKLLKEFGSLYISGTIMTVEITVAGTLIGYLLGFISGIIGAARQDAGNSKIYTCLLGLLKTIFRLYVFLFRGTPMIVQAMVIYYGSLQLFNIDLSPFVAAVIVVSLNTGAYMSETVRGGFLSIDKGQIEGATALGMSQLMIMIYIVIPQTIKNIFPQMGNNFIANIKDTSVLNIISVTELFFTTKTVAGSYYKFFEAYTITAVIYLILTFVFGLLFRWIEKKLTPKSNYELVDIEKYERELI